MIHGGAKLWRTQSIHQERQLPLIHPCVHEALHRYNVQDEKDDKVAILNDGADLRYLQPGSISLALEVVELRRTYSGQARELDADYTSESASFCSSVAISLAPLAGPLRI